MMFAKGFLVQLRENARDRQSETTPAQRRHMMTMQKDGQEHREDLPRGGHCGADEGVKVRHRIEDEALPHCRAQRELDDVREDLRVRHAEGHAALEVPERHRHHSRRQHHEQVRPEHEVVWLRMYTMFFGFALQSILKTSSEAVARQRHRDEEQTCGRGVRA